jgi:phosphinothricin acetyltransferase
VTLIGLATREDLRALVDIYNHNVATSNSNFDTEPTTLERHRDWFAKYSATGPYRLLVARRGGTVLGSASSGPYRDHEAFRETVEFSISLHNEHLGQGLGSLLYSALIESLADEPVHLAVAGIALPNPASVGLHRKFGFTEVGTFTEYAVKHGQYLSSVWMQRPFLVGRA